MTPNFKEYVIRDLLLNPNYLSDRARARALSVLTKQSESATQTQISRVKRKQAGSEIKSHPAGRGDPGSRLIPDGYFVYCIECIIPGYFYVGQTAFINKRIIQHKINKGAAFVKRYGFKQYFLVTKTKTRKEAINIEVLLWRVLKNKGVIAGGY